jgi:LmbE family N-acetylglucosaminyl deacetylase
MPARVAVLAPHPDDFDAIGVTMRRLHQKGDRIELAVLTGGANGVLDGFGGAYTPLEKALIREAEQRASCAFFGLPEERLSFLRLEGEPTDQPRVREFLDRGRPDMIFLPHGNDANATHRRVYALLRAVAGESGLAARVFLNRDPKTIAMRHDLLTFFGPDDAAWKGELLRHHASQHARCLARYDRGLDERVLAVNRQVATEAGRPGEYAEAFEIEQL